MWRFLCVAVLVAAVEGGTRMPRSPYCGSSSVNMQAGQKVILTSPYYPYPYPNPLACKWVAQAPANTVFRFQCPMFSVLSSTLCQIDRLLVSQSGDVSLSDGSAITFCGAGPIDIVINNNRFVAKFISKLKYFYTGNTGFYCVLTAVPTALPATVPPATGPPTTGPTKTGQCGVKGPSRIVGGQESGPNEWPWQVAVRNKVLNFLFCGGVLVAEQWVVTAAHCAQHYPQEQVYITIGDHRRNPSSPTDHTIMAEIAKVIIHENYTKDTVNNDIALLQLSEAVNYSDGVQPICLPCSVAAEQLQGQRGTVTGWGATSYGGPITEVLHEVELPILTTSECQEFLGSVVTNNMICTYKHDYDACQGDSGGPLVWTGQDGRQYLVGVVSWGYGCAIQDSPGVYVKVTNFLAWIQSKTGITVCP